MSNLISITDCDIADAHGSQDEVKKYWVKRSQLEDEKDPKTGNLLRPWHFEVVPGFFKQSDSKTDDSSFNYLDEHFGVNMSWDNLIKKLNELNDEADNDAEYKLVFCARHGQGYHNQAVERYGLDDWNNKWSKMTGTTLPTGEKLVWAPDPRLSPLGIKQAEAVHKRILKELDSGMPVPDKLFTSPFTRSATTMLLTWKGITLCDNNEELPDRKYPIVKENLRETIGVHLCDKRGTKSDFIRNFGHWGFKIEKGFPEQDIFYKDDWREPLSDQSLRADLFLQDLFENYGDDRVIYTTSHAGEIRALITATGHRQFCVPTAGVLPMVIKGTREIGN